PTSAHALTDRYSELPESKKQVWRGFQQYLAGHGAPDSLTTAQRAEFDKLVADYGKRARGTDGAAGSRASKLWTRMRTFGSRGIGLLGRLPVGSTIGLGVTSATIGYTIGSGINKMFFGFNTPRWTPPANLTSAELEPMEEGWTKGTNGQEAAPEDGYAVKGYYSNPTHSRYHWLETQPFDPCGRSTIAAPTIGEGDPSRGPASEGALLRNFSSFTGTCDSTGVPHFHQYKWHFVPLSTLPMTVPAKPYNPNDPEHQPSRLTPIPTQPIPPDFPQKVEAEMEKPANNDIEQYALDQLDPQPDGSPRPDNDFEEEWTLVPAPNPGETYDAYVGRLQEAGVQGQREDLTEAGADPNYGPNVAIRTNPPTPRNVNPADPPTTVTVYTNPPTMPPVEEGGAGTCDDRSVRQFDLSPLHIDPGSVFPFGVFGYLSGSLDALTANELAPVLSTDFGGLLPSPLVLDFSIADPARDIIHPVIIVLALITLVAVVASAVMGLGTATTKEN
ncbi:MAG: hypothetical protein M3134_10035, partial [Actinomycetota bacterium]|nr:hypothetical protein [Actinomycetota bacterium]